MEHYIGDFQRIVVKVLDVSTRRITALFIEVFAKSLKGLIKALEPSTLQEAIKRALALESSLPQS